MKFEDLKQDSFVHWKANRMFKAWDTYGKVVAITKDEVKILTFDDFVEATISLTGDSVKNEISLCDKNDALDYLQIRMAKLNTKKVELEVVFKREIREIDNQITKIKEFNGNIGSK